MGMEGSPTRLGETPGTPALNLLLGTSANWAHGLGLVNEKHFGIEASLPGLVMGQLGLNGPPTSWAL